jgi:thiol-disulfide isomerase/thioredoxin
MRRLLPMLGALVLGGCASAPLPPLTGGESAPMGSPQSGASPEDAAAASRPLAFQVKHYPGGEAYDIASDRGSVVLLDVWATWCEPCRDALPTYEALSQEYGKRGLKVYALNVDEDPRAIPPFVQETKVAVPILLDANAQVAERMLKVRLMPTTFLIDRAGVVRHVHEGFAEEFLQQYQSEIEALLSEPAH